MGEGALHILFGPWHMLKSELNKWKQFTYNISTEA